MQTQVAVPGGRIDISPTDFFWAVAKLTTNDNVICGGRPFDPATYKPVKPVRIQLPMIIKQPTLFARWRKSVYDMWARLKGYFVDDNQPTGLDFNWKKVLDNA